MLIKWENAYKVLWICQPHGNFISNKLLSACPLKNWKTQWFPFILSYLMNTNCKSGNILYLNMKNNHHNIVKVYSHYRHYSDLQIPFASTEKYLCGFVVGSKCPILIVANVLIFKFSLEGLTWIKNMKVGYSQHDEISNLFRFILPALTNWLKAV